MMYLMKTVLLAGVYLSVLPTCCVCFSRGASTGTCMNMKPGHLTVYPQNTHMASTVTIHTSRTVYLPHHTLMVSVRSSRAFMGLLLHARSVVEDRVVEGKFTLHPPGTHTLSCQSTSDTITHSDKLLKRNLSFNWRAPAQPSGDLRFYITVVHSYFIYWTRIHSAVVHDGTRKTLSGHNAEQGQNGISSALHLEPSAALQRSLTDPVKLRNHPEVVIKHLNPEPHPEGKVKTGGGVKADPRPGLVSRPVLLLLLSLGVLLALAVYIQRKHCVWRSGVSLSDSELEHTGARRMQDCGELVQLRQVRENSLLLLQAQYDLFTAPGK